MQEHLRLNALIIYSEYYSSFSKAHLKEKRSNFYFSLRTFEESSVYVIFHPPNMSTKPSKYNTPCIEAHFCNNENVESGGTYPSCDLCQDAADEPRRIPRSLKPANVRHIKKRIRILPKYIKEVHSSIALILRFILEMSGKI